MAIGAAGCTYETRVERVPVAAAGERESVERVDRIKPLPPDARLYDRDLPPEPPFDDPPLVNQKTPEQAKFEEGYRAVGRPRITVFVNRTLEGAADAGYLKHGQYDEAQAKALDYQALENVLTDVMACQGTVEVMSPTMVRQKLTDEQIKDLQSNKPRVLREVAQQLETDILIQVSAHPTRQTQDGLEFRLVGEALNIKGGQQIARAVVDIPPPLDKYALNRYTRFMARKMMMDMTQAWSTSESPSTAPPQQPAQEKPPTDPDRR
jgi:hypothetical protein